MTSKRGTAPSSTTRGDSMFLMALGEDPRTMRAAEINATGIDDTDDTGGAPILSWSLGNSPTKRDPPAKEPVYDRAEPDGRGGEPLFVRGADITAPDDSRPTKSMNCMGAIGGFAPAHGRAFIEATRPRDPRKIIPIYC